MRTSAYYPTKTFDSLSHFTGGQFALAIGGQFEMAEGGYFTVARGGQFAWVFHAMRLLLRGCGCKDC